MFMLLALPSTPQQRADDALRIWQDQRKAGIKPEHRHIPDDAFHRDLSVIQSALERTR